MLYRFDAFELDTELFQLRQSGTPAHVEPLVFDLLCCLAENPGRVLSRDDIVDQVWRGRIVSDATIAGCIKSARKALGDSGDKQRFIRTVRGRGFQFMGQVTKEGALDGAPLDDPAPIDPAPAAANPDASAAQPSLAILPFAVFGDDPDLADVANGLVATLSTVLTRVPLLSVASRAAGAAFANRAVGAEEVGSRLGVSYLLEGSIQTVGDTIQANVQLIATRHGFHLWAQQFDAPHDGKAKASLLHAILARLEPQLVRAIYNDQRGADGALTGRQLLIKAMSVLSLSGWHTASFTEVADLLHQSVVLEPDLALAHAYLSLILALGQRIGIERASGTVVQQALDEAETALRLDNMDSNVVGLAGCAIADVGQPDRAIPILKNAIDLNPNNGHAWAALGSAYLIVGKVDEAVDHLQRGVDVSPLDSRLSIWFALLALACLMAGDLKRALAAAQTGCQSNDRTYLPRVAETAVHLAAGDQASAAKSLAECYRVKPDLTPDQIARLVGPDLGAAMAAMRAA